MRRTRAAGSVPAMIKTRRLFFERGARYPLRFAMLPLLPALVRQVQLCCAGAALQRLALPEVLADRRKYLLLCTRGLEDQAEALLWRSLGREVPSWRIPPPQDLPRVSEGHAAVGKLVIGLKDDEDFPCGGIPGIIHIYALVDSARGLSDDKEAAMKQLLTWTAGLGPELLTAVRLTPASTATEATFRASVVRDGEHNFTSEEAMPAVGGGVGMAMPWKVNLKTYDIEVTAIIHRDTVVLGLSCAQLGKSRRGATQPSKLPREQRPWHLSDARHLRFSTARLLLELAEVSAGDRLLDLCGGMGTIALEAACCFPDLRAVSADVSQRACQRAEANVAAARSLGLLGLGSSVEVLVRGVSGWTRSSQEFDVVVSELPFGVSISILDSNVLLTAIQRVVRPGGRVVLIAPCSESPSIEEHTLSDTWCEYRRCDGNVGGTSVHILYFRRADRAIPGKATSNCSELMALAPEPAAVERILGGLHEWRDVQGVIRTIFQALCDVAHAQSNAVREDIFRTCWRKHSDREQFGADLEKPANRGHPLIIIIIIIVIITTIVIIVIISPRLFMVSFQDLARQPRIMSICCSRAFLESVRYPDDQASQRIISIVCSQMFVRSVLTDQVFFPSFQKPGQPRIISIVCSQMFVRSVLTHQASQRIISIVCSQMFVRSVLTDQVGELPKTRSVWQVFTDQASQRIISIVCSQMLVRSALTDQAGHASSASFAPVCLLPIFQTPSQPRIISISCSGLYGKVLKRPGQPRILSIICSEEV
ncbi:THUMPD3 [Symbiodinium microadriaticum]|nr:THUMPD3 [Symbiodinium microadriaticum]